MKAAAFGRVVEEERLEDFANVFFWGDSTGKVDGIALFKLESHSESKTFTATSADWHL